MADKRKIHIHDDEEPREELIEDIPSDDLADEEDVEALRQRCDDAEKRAEEEHERLLRTLAEYANFRRRSKEELHQARKFGTEDFVIRLLPIMDNFDRAIKAAEEAGDFDALHGGVILILRQLQDLVQKEGVEPIEAVGQEFDPSIHEAVMREDTDDHPDNTVIEEFQKGYVMGDKVIRPSMVKVARNP